LQALDAVSNATVEMCHTAAYYFIGKDPTFALYASIPFGLNSRQQNAWFQDHGDQDMLNEFGKKLKLYFISGGNTGTQMGGWRSTPSTTSTASNSASADGPARPSAPFRSRLRAVISIRLWKRASSTPPNGSGAHDDEKLGFYKVANYSYYPGC
jgi:TRAP-type mannitol/chloroaromatic compound transport system substrate-binding protein